MKVTPDLPEEVKRVLSDGGEGLREGRERRVEEKKE